MDLWKLMGLDGQRVIIIHHDDLGITEAQARAYRALGFPTASVMLTAPWAPLIREGDLGVHLTLNSEWQSPRTRPLTHGPSLRDPAGYFWPALIQAWEHVDVADAAAEMRAQVEAALALGIDVTHLDTHMGAVLRPDIANAYNQLAIEYRLPALLPHEDELGRFPAPFRAGLAHMITSSPLPKMRLVDGYAVAPADRRAWYLDTLSKLGPGVYHLIHHAAEPTPEGRALTDWEGRRADLESLLDPEVRRLLGEFRFLTYREVRDAMRRYL